MIVLRNSPSGIWSFLLHPIVTNIFFCSILNAQEFTTKVYTTKDGMPSSFVYSTVQDDEGYLWIGGPNGMSRFDGKRFVNYGLAEGLPDILGLGMFVDANKRHWAITSKGPALFAGEKFIFFPFSDSAIITWVTGIAETTSGSLLATTNTGVYELRNKSWEKIALYPGYDNHFCRNIIETVDGIYINYGDLLVLQEKDGSFKIIGSKKQAAYFYNQLTFSYGRMFVSTIEGICEINSKKLVKLPGLLGSLKGIYVFKYDCKKRIWVGQHKAGLRLFYPDKVDSVKTVIRPSVDFLPQSITEDDNKNYWIGSGNGLVKITESGLKLFNVSAVVNRRNMLRYVLCKPEGSIILNNGTLNYYEFVNGHFLKLPLRNAGHTPLPNNEFIIDKCAFDDKGRQWNYVRGFSLVVQEGNKLYNQQKEFAHLGKEAFDVLFDEYRRKILVAINPQNFPSIYDNGVYKILAPVNSIQVRGLIRHLFQSSEGKVLFSTDLGYIYSIDKENYCKLELSEFGNKRGISQFCGDPGGGVWILYPGRGARFYRWLNGKLVFQEEITKAHGLSGDNVSAICFDNKNRLWLSVNSDIFVFARQAETNHSPFHKMVGCFDSREIQGTGEPESKLMKDDSGNIWFSSSSKLVCFEPEKVNFMSHTPAIAIEHINLDLKETNWLNYTDSVAGMFRLPYRPKLDYYNNTLQIVFRGICISGSGALLYSYKLKGLQDIWSPESANDLVSFVKLPPGQYQFEVKTRFPYTQWSQPAIFTFEIQRAFWQTWWFAIVCLAGFFIIIYFFYRRHIRQLHKIMDMRRDISRDLHDEIGSALTSIQILSKVTKNFLKQDITKSESMLEKISMQSQAVQQSISDIVWAIKPDNDKTENLAAHMREYLAQAAEPKDIAIDFSVSAEMVKEKVSMQQRHHLFLIFKEAVNNCIRHAQPTKITVCLGWENEHIVLGVDDDGNGFVKSEKANCNGLKNMEHRARAIKGVLTIFSEKGKGTRIRLVCKTTQ